MKFCRVLSLLVFALSLSILPHTISSAPISEVDVALIISTAGVDPTYALFIQRIIAVCEYAVSALNANPGILPHTNITFTVIESQANTAYAAEGAIKHVSENPGKILAFLSTFPNIISEIVGTMASVYDIPHGIFLDQSVGLVDNSRFHTSYRTVCHL